MNTSEKLIGSLILALCVAGCSKQSDESSPGGESQQGTDAAAPERKIPVAEAVRNINSILDEIEARDKKLPHREFDPAALAAALGADPKAQYEWVRDHTTWVPYRGLLRGSRGVLLDRVGSSVDRAVLLGDLLRRTGHEVRLARATLSQHQASGLIAPMKSSRPWRPDTGSSEYSSAPIFSQALALASAGTAPLVAAFEFAAERSRGDSSTIEAIQDHWWVEYLADGKWVALDLLAPAADEGRAIAAASGSYVWESASGKPPVPDQEWHSVNVRVVVERYDGAATTESAALEKALRPAELLGMHIELTHYPTPWPEEFPFSVSQPNALGDAAVQVREWLPMLLIGDETMIQSGIADDGTIIADPLNARRDIAESGGAGFMVGFGEALGGGTASQSFMTAEWLDFEFHVPGLPVKTIRRPIFDLLGPENRSARLEGFDAGTNDLLVKRYQALVGMYSILIQPCAFTEDYVSHLAMRTFLEVRDDVQRLGVENEPKQRQNIVSSISAHMEVWQPLSRLAHMRFLLSKEAADWFIDQPNVLILGKGLPVVNADKAALIAFIDIASNSIGVRPDPALNAFHIRLRQGLIDTIAEQVALTGNLDKGENPATTFALGDADAWQVIHARDLDAARKLDWPDDAAALLAEDIKAGYAAYVPRQAFEYGGRPRRGWWRVDPLSGETVGVMDNGLHPALTEKKFADMTTEERKIYYINNYDRWKNMQNLHGNNLGITKSPNDVQMMSNMLQIKNWMATL